MVSFAFQAEYNKTHPNPILQGCQQALLGEMPTQEALDAVSPELHVSEHTPPIFAVHAADDSMVPVNHSLLLSQAMTKAGRPFELHIFQQGDHGFALGGPMGRPWELNRARAARAWVELVKTWLLKQYIPEAVEEPLPPFTL